MTRAIRPVDADGDGFRTISSALVRDLPVGVVVQSAEGTIVEANAAAERILGLTRDQMMGRTSVDPRWRSVRRDGTPFPGADHPSMRAIREGGIQRELMGVHKPDGSVTWIEIEARRVADQPESPVFACFVDVTAERDSERRLRAALRRSEALAALSSEAVLILDTRLCVVSASGNVARVLGAEPEELAGTPVAALAEFGQREEMEGRLRSLLVYPGARGRWDLALRLANGQTRTFEGIGMNLLSDATVAGIVLNLRDIQDQRTAEVELRAANEQLERRLAEMSADRAFDSGLARLAELLQHCATPAEANDVLHACLSALLPAYDAILYLESEEQLEFVRHGGQGAPVFLPIHGCWALRTQRAHLTGGALALRCEHVEHLHRPTACLPLLVGGHAVALLELSARDPAVPLPPRDELDRLGARLGIVFGNARPRAAERTQ
jgi:PAS domain S-box-containing protein